MIPKRIKPYFKTINQSEDGDGALIEGELCCCGENTFEVFAVGEVKHGLLNTYLLPENDTLALEVRCKSCGKTLTVFDSPCDGYEHCGTGEQVQSDAKPVACRKCRENDFSVKVKYEYPDAQELRELGITDADNAFTWIRVTLKCRSCGKGYKNFIDFETA